MTKTLLSIATFLLFIGVVGGIVTYQSADPVPIAVTKEIEPTDFQTINVQTSMEKVEILSTNDHVPRVELTGKESNNDRTELSVEVDNDTLTVRTDQGARKWLRFDLFSYSRTLSIYLPDQTYGQLVVDVSNGRITAKGLKMKGIELTAKNGRIEVDNTVADHYQLRTYNGRMNILNVEGDITAKSDNGRISITTKDLERNMNVKANNGRITIETEQLPTNVEIDAKTNNGSVDLFGQSSDKRIYGNGDNLVELYTENGSITVSE
ncbi:DUF4097 family beta strand repeat-containing protein [Gracilibacillus sp. S3-1-1]|uniref:DUF4097 family beta strand repeat-containing protein n=1 Tax=Gracilibacillus pellucidus TaxID=3095368 RepID=A0ACC6M6J6_9BACI|nr:DUF4097 family beta strand repeat-containing protein [Gracilibacillus sp. S3-1-1]MDX8046392.1 DUF4097 family beta strand repeat-containing protein [Gracilibacillus sp. S3-1-1]